VLDVDGGSKGGALSGDPLGSVETTVAAVVAARAGVFTAQLGGSGAKRGSLLTVVGEEMAACKGVAVIALRGLKLANRCAPQPSTARCAATHPSRSRITHPPRRSDGWFGKSDPFWRLSKLTENGMYVQVAQSVMVANNLNPTWQPVRVPIQRLCNGDLQRPLRLEVLDYDADDKNKPIGHCDTCAAALLATGTQLALKHPRGKPKPVGTVSVTSAQVMAEPSFMEYIAGGMEISLLVGIDLTASNGEPSDPRSLHYRGGATPNAYQTALAAVGAVLAPYDTDGRIPAYGYGAALPPANVVSHCFALSGAAHDPACDGVAGVLAAYDTALASVRLSGPTCFAPLISAAAAAAEMAAAQQAHSYHVLLIITDGEIMARFCCILQHLVCICASAHLRMR
jgi:hypothetical protein